jgi:hypothetical protein
VHTAALALRSLALAFWFGGGLATLLATSAVFARAGGAGFARAGRRPEAVAFGDRKLAGDLAGAILLRTGVVRSAMVLVLLSAIVLGAAGPSIALGVACVLLQIAAVVADVLTRRARRQAGGSIDTLPPDDPRRRRFAALHGVAMLLLLLQVVAAGTGLALAG